MSPSPGASSTPLSLNHFNRLFTDSIPAGSGRVYGANETQSRTGVSIVPLAQLKRLFTLAESSD